MKKLIFGLMIAFAVNVATADTWTDPATGIMWRYEVSNGEASLGEGLVGNTAIPQGMTGELMIPSVMGGFPVTSIGYAFAGCSGLTSVTIPLSVTNIGDYAFAGCSGLAEIKIPSSVTSIGYAAFSGCSGLTSVTIPSSVTSIGCAAFGGCRGLIEVHISDLSAWCKIDSQGSIFAGEESNPLCLAGHLYLGDRELTECVIPDGVTDIKSYAFEGCRGLTSVTIPPSVTNIGWHAFSSCSGLKDVYFKGEGISGISESAFDGCDVDLILHAGKNWKGRRRVLCGIDLRVDGESEEGGGGAPSVVNLTVTNVVVNYVLNSVQPEFAIPATSDTGFVNIITEVKGGAVAIPSSWAENYPAFESKFGLDFTKALSMKTGKKDGAGNDMLVWQDYVAGTDPTKPEDKFTASITVVEGKVTVSCTPELDDDRKALRKYTTWGKKSLLDAN